MLMIMIFPYVVLICIKAVNVETKKEEIPMYREERYRNVQIDFSILVEAMNLITDERLCPLNF